MPIHVERTRPYDLFIEHIAWMLFMNQMGYKGASDGVGESKGKGKESEAIQRKVSKDKKEKCGLGSQWGMNLESDLVCDYENFII